jgi:NADH-quinone oxidoreductase subunit L
VFHLVTLGVFQSLLFLASGAVIHMMAGEANMQRMGGLRQYMPVTFVTMMVGALAMTGIPPLAGFFSMNGIAAGIFPGHRTLWAITSVTTVLIAVCVSRLIGLTFFGTYRGPANTRQSSSSAEAPMPVIATLMALAVAAIVLGFAGAPSVLGGSSSISRLLALPTSEPQAALSPGTMLTLAVMSAMMPVAGILIARQLYLRDPGMRLPLDPGWRAIRAILANRSSLEEFYSGAIVRGTLTAARGLFLFDHGVNACVNACGWVTQIAAWIAHMFEKHVIDRIVDSLGWIVGRVGFLARMRRAGSLRQ